MTIQESDRARRVLGGSRAWPLWLAIVGTLGGVSPAAFSQEPAPSQQEAGPESPAAEAEPPIEVEATPPAAPAISDVVGRGLEEARSRVREIGNSLAPPEPVRAIERELPGFLDAFRRLRDDPRSQNLEGLSLNNLSDFRGEWLRKRSQLDAWSGVLTARLRYLEGLRDELQELQATWQRRAGAALEVPGAVRERMTELILQIEDAEDEVKDRLQSVLNLEASVSEPASSAAEHVARLDAALNAARRGLFTLESPPIWKRLMSEEQRSGLRAAASDSLRNTTALVRSFLQAQQPVLVAHFILFVLLAALLSVLGRRSRQWAREDPSLEPTAKALSLPMSASLLISILAVPWLYPTAPRVVYVIGGMLALIPVLALIPRMVPPAVRPAIYALAVIYVANKLYRLVPDGSFLSRLLLLLGTLLCIAALVWFQRPHGLLSAAAEGRYRNAALLTLRLATATMVLSATANVLGGVQLAELLNQGIIGSGYIALGLYAAKTILRGATFVGMRTDFVRQLGGVRRHEATLRERVTKVLDIVAILMWLSLTAWALNVSGIFWDWATAALGRKWTIGSLELTLGGILAFVITLYISVLVSRFIRWVLAEDVLPRLALPRGIPSTISMLVNYAVLTIGFFIAAAAAGFKMSQFALIAGALGVSIGFGLQTLVNNFVSGLILIFERPIKVGDTVELGSLLGEVRTIGIRASTVRTLDGAEVIIPNGNLLADQVINWTKSDRLRRITVEVGVAYGTDPQKVLELLVATTAGDSEILEHPGPNALFLGFGESSLNFILRFWTPNFDDWLKVRSRATVRVNQALKEAGFEIPFPQRDLHLRSVDPRAGRTLVSGDEADA